MQSNSYAVAVVVGLVVGLLAVPVGVGTTGALVEVIGDSDDTVDTSGVALQGEDVPAWKGATWQYLAAQFVQLESQSGPETDFDLFEREQYSDAAFTTHQWLSSPVWLYAVPVLVLGVAGGVAAAGSTRLLGDAPGPGVGAFVAVGH